MSSKKNQFRPDIGQGKAGHPNRYHSNTSHDSHQLRSNTRSSKGNQSRIQSTITHNQRSSNFSGPLNSTRSNSTISNKKLPPLPRNSNFQTPFACDTLSEVSTIASSKASDSLGKKFSSSLKSSSLNSTIADLNYDSNEDIDEAERTVKKKFSMIASKRLSIMDALEASEEEKKHKSINVFNMALNEKQQSNGLPTYSSKGNFDGCPKNSSSLLYASSFEGKKSLLSQFKKFFNKQNIMYSMFAFLSFATTVVFVIIWSLYLKNQYIVSDDPDIIRESRIGVLYYYFFLVYSKIYQFGVVLSTFKTKSNTQLVLLFLYLFLITVIEMQFSIVNLIQQQAAVKQVVELLRAKGIDIYHDAAQYPEKAKQFHDNFQLPRIYSITAMVCICVFLGGQILMWFFYIAKDFSWETFIKTGASVRARKLVDEAHLFNSLLVFLGGLIMPFFVCAYIAAISNAPFYISCLLLALVSPFVLVYNSWAYKKDKVLGLSVCLLYYCYLFFNMVQYLCVMEAKEVLSAAIVQYYCSGLLFLALVAIFILNCKKISEADFDYEISPTNLNCIFLCAVNLANFILGACELAFFARYNSSEHASIMYAKNWMICYLFGVCYCLLMTVICCLNPRHYVNFLSVYLVWVFNNMVLLFQFANIMYTVTGNKLLNIAQGLQLGVIILVSIFWAIISMLVIQIFRNNNIDKIGTYNIESYKASGSNEAFDFKIKGKIVKFLEFLSASSILFTYLIVVFSIQFLKFDTENWSITTSQAKLSISVAVLMAIINVAHHFIINKLKYYIIGLSSFICFSLLFMAFPIYCLAVVASKYTAIENALYLPETTDLKISMALSVVLFFFIIGEVGLSAWVIKLQRSLRY